MLNVKPGSCKYQLLKSFGLTGKHGGGGATQPLLRDEGEEELHGDLAVGPRPKVWTRGQKMARRRDSDAGQFRKR